MRASEVEEFGEGQRALKGVRVGSSICRWGGWGPAVRVKDDSFKFLPVSSSRMAMPFTKMEIIRKHTWGKRSRIGALNVLSLTRLLDPRRAT